MTSANEVRVIVSDVVAALAGQIAREANDGGRESARANDMRSERNELRQKLNEVETANGRLRSDNEELKSLRSHAIELVDACQKSKHTTPRMTAAIDSLKKALTRTEEPQF